MRARESPHILFRMNAKHISFTCETKEVLVQIRLALNILDIRYQCAIGVVPNPTKRPHFITMKWTIVVHNENLDTVKDIIKLINPILKYKVKDGHFVERMQRLRSPQYLNV